MKLRLSAQETANIVLEKMGKIIKEYVDGLLAEINNKPVYTIRELLYGKKLDPKLINVIGGPAKILAPILEKIFCLPCYYPENYLVANAIGAALARPTMEINIHVDTSKRTLSIPELGIYESVSPKYTLEMAKERAKSIIIEKAKDMGIEYEDVEAEITEESSFNMVRGFYTAGKDIRVKAQITPGHMVKLRGDDNA